MVNKKNVKTVENAILGKTVSSIAGLAKFKSNLAGKSKCCKRKNASAGTDDCDKVSFNKVHTDREREIIPVSKKDADFYHETSVKDSDNRLLTTEQILEAHKKRFTKEDINLFEKSCEIIREDLENISESYLQTAFCLYSIYDRKLYKIRGAGNIYDFAKEEFQISRSTCNGFINICKRFAEIKDGVCVGLKDEYKRFSSSKLMLMVSMDDGLIEKITPDMTASQIRKMKKEAAASIKENSKGKKHSYSVRFLP